MNPFGGARLGKEAEVRFLDSDYQVLSPGGFVKCAVTGIPIPLDELKYWSASRQEAYLDAASATKRYQETDAKVDHPNLK